MTGQRTPSGWYPDPFERFEQRWWDGAAWTGSVWSAGTASTDPPVHRPSTPTATPGAPFLEAHGPEARERPEPRLTTALAGIGGLAVAAGVLSLGSEADDRGPLILLSLLVTIASYLIVVRLRHHHVARAAAVGAAALGIGGLGVAVGLNDAGDNISTVALIAGVMYAAAWSAPGFRGRPLLLGLSSLALVAAIGNATSGAGGCDQDDFDCLFAESEGTFLPSQVTDTLGTQGTVYLLCATALLGTVWVLDRRGYRGTATSLVVSGLLTAIVGASLLATRFDSAGGAALVALVGLIVCLVGSHGARRATTWWGAAMTSSGLIALLAVSMKPTSPSSVAALLMTSGAILIFGPLVVASVRSSGEADRANSAGGTGQGWAPPG